MICHIAEPQIKSYIRYVLDSWFFISLCLKSAGVVEMYLESWFEGRKSQRPIVQEVKRTSMTWGDIGGHHPPPAPNCSFPGIKDLIQDTFWAWQLRLLLGPSQLFYLGLLSSGADKEQILLPSGSGLRSTLPLLILWSEIEKRTSNFSKSSPLENNADQVEHF